MGRNIWLHPSSDQCTYQPGQQRSWGHHPHATDPACTLGTIPSATCSSHAPRTTLPCTTSHTTSGTTPALWLSPGQLGPDANYYPAPAQPYPISYPPGPWSPYQQYYAGPHGHGEEDSKTDKPDKFMGQDPSKLCPFIVSCIMAFDSQPHKFATDQQ